MSGNNKISDLRGELFNMLRTLQKKDEQLDLDRFRVGNSIAQTIIDSARVEVEFIRTFGAKDAPGTGFMTLDHEPAPAGDGGSGAT